MKTKSFPLQQKVITGIYWDSNALGCNNEDNEFDMIVGTLQEILLDNKFELLQKKFCSENCMHFEATEENKLIYTDIFKRYQDNIESYISHVHSNTD